MGLIKEDRGFAVLSDILGDEDHLGDMDFKVAGTERRRHRAADGHQDHRDHAGDHAGGAGAGARRAAAHPRRDGQGADRARSDVAANAPRIIIINVPKEKIRDVIGTGGKVIREIVEETGTKIDIEDDGTIKIAGHRARTAAQRRDRLDPRHRRRAGGGRDLQRQGREDRGFRRLREFPRLPRRPRAYQRTDAGAGRKTSDVVNVGDPVKVKVLGFDERGKVKLSMRVVDQVTGEDITEKVGPKGGRGEGRREREAVAE